VTSTAAVVLPTSTATTAAAGASATLEDITHLQGCQEEPAQQRQIPKESDGSLLTPPEAYVKRNSSGHISALTAGLIRADATTAVISTGNQAFESPRGRQLESRTQPPVTERLQPKCHSS